MQWSFDDGPSSDAKPASEEPDVVRRGADGRLWPPDAVVRGGDPWSPAGRISRTGRGHRKKGSVLTVGEGGNCSPKIGDLAFPVWIEPG